MIGANTTVSLDQREVKIWPPLATKADPWLATNRFAQDRKPPKDGWMPVHYSRRQKTSPLPPPHIYIVEQGTVPAHTTATPPTTSFVEQPQPPLPISVEQRTAPLKMITPHTIPRNNLAMPKTHRKLIERQTKCTGTTRQPAPF